MTVGSAAARAYVRRHGEDVTVVERSVSRNEASDWDDETVTETEHTVPALAERTDSSGRETNEAERGRVADMTFTLRDDAPVFVDDTRESNDELPTLIRHNGVTYVVVTFEEQANGTLVVEGERV